MKTGVWMSCLAAVWLSACGGGSDEVTPATAVFEFRLHDLDASEAFRVRITQPEVIAQARAQLALPVAERNLHPSGGLVAGNGGVNGSWGWHLGDAALAEMSIELCDARPSMVQADLDYWLGTVKSFCPWSGYVYAEVVE